SEMCGAAPIAIAYPNGLYNEEIVQICRDLGLRIGFTTCQRKTPLPFAGRSSELMKLGRFCLHGKSPILRQCRTCRSDLQMYSWFRDGYVSMRNKRRAATNGRDNSAVPASSPGGCEGSIG